MKKYPYLLLFGCIINLDINAQNIAHNSDAIKLADRIITINGTLSDSIFTHSSFITDYEMAEFLNDTKTQVYDAKWSNADIRDINTFLLRSPNANISTRIKSNSNSNTSFFYNYSPHLFSTKNAKNYLSIDPTAQAYYHFGDKYKIYNTSLGALINGRIADRIGITIGADYHIEQMPKYFEAKTQKHSTIPNAGEYIQQGNQYQYLMLNAQASVDIIKNGLTATIGQGKHFIGDGIRSLIISDYSAPMPFLSFQTKIGKFHYTNLFLKMSSQTFDAGFDVVPPQKYAAIHYLSINATKWLNIGLFESIISSRDGAPEIGYFNPMIFYRAIERAIGSPDKMAIGITAKIIPVKKVQLYGQFFINEFTSKYFFSNKGYIHNKWGAQGGIKYFNAIGINNLDLQAEVNIVRPYAYQHRSNSNFSNYNQPLAHPLGAGFREGILSISMRPFSKVRMNLIASYYQQGIDTSVNMNYGSDVLKNIKNNSGLFGVKLINGVPIDVLGVQFNAAYEIFPSLLFEGGVSLRNLRQKSQLVPDQEETYAYIGFRYNVQRRNFLQF